MIATLKTIARSAGFDRQRIAAARMCCERLGFAPESFAIPLGQSANWRPEAEKAARDAGYSVIYAQAEETRPKGAIARSFITKFDDDRIFRAPLKGKFDYWEEWG